MSNASWKEFERRVARDLGGQRRGADTGGVRGGKTDIIHPFFGVECKLLGRVGLADILNACVQAELNSEPHQIPIAVVKKKHGRMDDCVVAMRYNVWREWYGPALDEEREEDASE